MLKFSYEKKNPMTLLFYIVFVLDSFRVVSRFSVQSQDQTRREQWHGISKIKVCKSIHETNDKRQPRLCWFSYILFRDLYNLYPQRVFVRKLQFNNSARWRWRDLHGATEGEERKRSDIDRPHSDDPWESGIAGGGIRLRIARAKNTPALRKN